MNKEKYIKVVLELTEKVSRLNFEQGTKLQLYVDEKHLEVRDAENGFKSLLEGELPSCLYFEEFWNSDFDKTFDLLNEKLDLHYIIGGEENESL